MRCIPSSFAEGLSWGRLQKLSGRAPCPPLAAVSTLRQCLESGNKSPGTLYSVNLLFLLIVKPTVNKGGLVCPRMWGRSFEWGRSCKDTGQPEVGLGSCLLPGAGLNQLGPSGMELPRPWHQILIRRDPAPG